MNPKPKPDDKKSTSARGGSAKLKAIAYVHDGNVVKISGKKLVILGENGKERSHTVAADAKVTCDGSVCRIEDLKIGAKIRLTTKPEDRHVAAKIESLQSHAEFTPIA